MDIKVTHKMIKEMCGTVAFKKGDSFYRAKKVTFNQYRSDYCHAIVNGAEDFHVTIEKDAKGIKAVCSCPKLENYQKSCQHVAAVLLAISEYHRLGISPLDGNDQAKNKVITDEFMKIFKYQTKRNSGQKRHFENREVLDIQFILKPISTVNNQNLFGIELEIGHLKVQNIREFLQDVNHGKPSRVSSTFCYDPTIHCFSNISDEVIQQLIGIIEDENTLLNSFSSSFEWGFYNEAVIIPPSIWEEFIRLIENAPVTLENNGQSFGSLRVLNGPPPLQFTIEEMKSNGYQLTIDGFEQLVILDSYKCVISKENIFCMEEKDSERLSELKKMLPSMESNHISISYSQFDYFLNNVVPGLKKIGEVHFSKAVTQKILNDPLIAKLYLDRVNNRLLAGLEFQYENAIIQPLENRDISIGPMIFRDLDSEEKILQLMDNSGFSKTEGGYYMQNEELEYEFLYHVLPQLQKLVQIFATTAIRNRIVTKNVFPKIRVKHKKDRMNWLEFKFEMNGIADDQIRDILAALEEKRKYYRLRDGSLLSLETKEMEELHRFLNEVPIQDDGFEDSLNVQTIQGLKYLDHLDSNIFIVEESFRKFIDQFVHPHSLDIEVPHSLKNILRDYQKDGYKWLKTLASYGFGGILADDMGLGKTIQSITYIVSELSSIRDKKLPVLIVCPSSLTYNWLHELMNICS